MKWNLKNILIVAIILLLDVEYPIRKFRFESVDVIILDINGVDVI